MSWLKFEVLMVMLSYAVIVGFILIGKRRAIKKSKFMRNVISQNRLEEISVVIPFRNEVENLDSLIYAIHQLKSGPLEFIFVNDHSNDESLQILNNTEWKYPTSILELPNDQFGKKAGLRKGISAAKGKYILTWDADIMPSENFFLELDKFTWQSLNILPVEMRDSGWVSGFFAWDYKLQTETALSVAGFVRPITASGANLLVKKDAFLNAENCREDEHLLSGDDQFLLSAFRESGETIQNIVSKELTVTTNSPQTIVDGISQRSRWLGKSKVVNDGLANGFGFIVLLIQLAYYAFAIYQLSKGNYGATIVLVLIKSELDAFICTYKFQEQFNTFQVFVYELLFPIYIFSLLFLSFFTTPKWKGRSIKKPF